MSNMAVFNKTPLKLFYVEMLTKTNNFNNHKNSKTEPVWRQDMKDDPKNNSFLQCGVKYIASVLSGL